ncbi:hypothetical protein LTR47_007747 [Exophiala xenobiotica]|nr:hypothetical protein LTR47_007747 [Exophiala xenobiotica]KAK5247414.1 hypothetical protein LTS06_007400 [Exophiala xenobiotica]KAK5348391.1 hypothetical protein LTR61_007850 [Exophiala xenobiotica]KAK5366278.1 hypothetical protein LTR11_008321 [Exophiala xenobiotica]KAK5367389.1 hypothetical protein LTS03_008431 [Exophiala xenobiotica]
MAQHDSDITLYFLGASRAIRIAWLLEELSLPYKLVSSPRASNGLAPPEFKAKIPTKLGKSPVIQDGNSIVIQESSAIAEYLCETYDTSSRLLPREPAARAKAREWMAAAEGTFMLHGLAILYARWRLPKAASEHLPEMEKGLSPNIHNDLNWLEGEVQGRQFLVSNDVTAADIMMGFSIEFIFARKLGTEGGDWPNVRKWLEGLQQREAYRKAVEKTGYSL